MRDLQLLGEQVRPATQAAERMLPLAAPLAGLVPGGLKRGSTVAVAGSGATALALAVMAGVSAAGSWVVAVGVPTLGLLAASELGLDLERMVLVAQPPANQWAGVVAALAESFEAVLVRPEHQVRPGDLRRLGARLRERGGVMCRLPGRVGTWPEAPDLTFTAISSSWHGIDPRSGGAGRLSARRLTVEVSGRRGADRRRRAELWLPGPDGRLALAGATLTGATLVQPAHRVLEVAG